jgi:purine-binding chemotaxis protein CheW
MSPEEGLDTSQYLTFKLADEFFAVNITKVREVLEFKEATKIPRTPEFMRGVINLRGNVVPVLDLKEKFGMGQTEKSVDTCVIITEVNMGEDSVVLGALADSVQEVFDMEDSEIEPAPSIGTNINTDFIHGMGKKDGEFVIVIDVDKVFNADELAALDNLPSG